MFLDEPTTGLDAASALAVMSTVRKACRKKTAICTIHQPSAEVFALFDWILLMAKGGRVTYFGPVADMSAYLRNNGMGTCPEGINPADFALEATKQAVSDPKNEGQLILPADLYDRSEWKQEMAERAPSKTMDFGDGRIGVFESECVLSLPLTLTLTRNSNPDRGL